MRNIAVVVAVALLIINMARVPADIPDCDYFDTVDLTNSQKFENGSYQYMDILIPKEKTGQYEYQVFFGGEREQVPKHTRGCACKIKGCARFCCDPRMVLVDKERRCENVGNNLAYNSILNITLDNGTVIRKNVLEYIVQQHLPVPCSDHLYSNISSSPKHGWTLFENGTLHRHTDDAMLSKADYCLQPVRQPGNPHKYELLPHQCFLPPDATTDYLQMLSIVFMSLLIALFPWMPNFKTVHGKCCICYFISLNASFLMLLFIKNEWTNDSGSFICYLISYMGYYFVMATFLWLLIINYNLCKAFHNIGVNRKARFINYNIFVWSVAAALLLVTSLVELFYQGDDVWKPGFGTLCWIDTSEWTAMIYFYGPISALLICNTTLFIKTANRIIVQNSRNRRQLKKSGCQRNLRNLTNFGVFFRLFVIVGVIWILEIASYICSINGIESKWLTIADWITSAQGIILFVVTILKMDVLKSLADRVRGKNLQNHGSQSSTITQIQCTEIRLLPKVQITSA